MRSRDCYNDVGNVHIRYDINHPTGKPVLSIRAYIEQNGERIGTISSESDGRLYLSFDYANEISFSMKREILGTVLTDIEGVFNESLTE